MKEIVEMMAKAIHSAQQEAMNIWAETDSPMSQIELDEVAARAALTAIEQAGFVVVPKEPTEAMIEAGEELIPVARGTESRRGTPNPEDVFAAMIETATRDESRDLSK